MKNTSDFKIIGKLHPGWGWKFNQTLIKIFNDIDPNIPVFNSKSIINLINECDIMININPEENQPSTVMLESLIMKKPVINISLDDNYSDSKFDEESSIISLSYSSYIMKYVNALFFDSEFKDRLELKIQNSLKKFLSNHKNASKEIANHLKSFV